MTDSRADAFRMWLFVQSLFPCSLVKAYYSRQHTGAFPRAQAGHDHLIHIPICKEKQYSRLSANAHKLRPEALVSIFHDACNSQNRPKPADRENQEQTRCWWYQAGQKLHIRRQMQDMLHYRSYLGSCEYVPPLSPC